MSKLRSVTVVVTNQTTPDVYLARSYPDRDIENDGREDRYKTPVYKLFLEGTDAAGNKTRKDWLALRFMPYLKESPRPRLINSGKVYVKRKLVPAYIKDYEVHNMVSAFGGAIQIDGDFLVHGGPETVAHSKWGAAGCVEVIGNFDDFRLEILSMAGSTQGDLHKGMREMVNHKKLYIQMDYATPPKFKLSRDGDF